MVRPSSGTNQKNKKRSLLVTNDAGGGYWLHCTFALGTEPFAVGGVNVHPIVNTRGFAVSG